jgi:tetratricopeptide (TPR) repeat protein
MRLDQDRWQMPSVLAFLARQVKLRASAYGGIMLANASLARWVALWSQLITFVLVVALVYSPCINGDYVWDDHDGLMLGNPQIEQAWGWLENWYAPETVIYEPLTFDSFWIQRHFFGENRAVFHLTNVLLHALNAWMLMRILHRLSLPGARLTALLFAVHPVCVETTAWIYERNNLLSTFFMLGSALAFLSADQSRRWYVAAILLFACSLLSKSLAVMFPFVLVGYCLSRTAAGRWSWLIKLVPFASLSIILGLVRLKSENDIHALRLNEFDSLAERCLNASQATSFYLTKAMWPWELWTVYPKWSNDPTHAGAYLASFPMVAALLLAVLLWRTTWRPISWGLAFFAINLMPLVGFVDNSYFQYAFVADRWQYLAIMGVLSGIGFAGARLTERLSEWKLVLRPGLAFATLVPLAIMSWGHAHVYQGMEAWAQFTLSKNPEAYFAHVNLASVLLERGEHQAAVRHLREAFRILPSNSKIALNLGLTLLQGMEVEEAAKVYRQAVLSCPNTPELYYNLGVAELTLGHRAAAARAFAKATEIDGKFAPAHDKLGALSVTVGKAAVGVKHLSIAVALEPQNAGYHFNLGTAHAGVEDFEASIASFQSALELEPLHRDARLYLAKVQMYVNRYEDANATLGQLLADHPGDTEAEDLLGKVQHRLTQASAFPAKR